jgi:hypothetical protein
MSALTPTQVVIGAGALLLVVLVWRAVTRKARAAARAARGGVRVVSLAGRVLVNATLIVLVQWVAISQHANGWLLLAVLAVPALVAGYTLTRALSVTVYEPPTRRGGGRR